MMQSESIGELAKALAEAQPHIKEPEKNGRANYGPYSTLADLRRAIFPALNARGIAITQLVMSDGGDDYVETKLIHSSNQWIGCRMKLKLDKPSMQSYGSAITYACRYMLNAIAGSGESEMDDDGEAAEKAQKSVRISAQNDPIHSYWEEEKASDHASPPSDPGERVVLYGKKYAGKKFKELTFDQVHQFIDWMKKEGKDQSASARRFISDAEEYLGTKDIPF